VSIRAKLLLIVIVLGLVPMLLLSIGYYRSGTHAVERLLRDDAAYRAAHTSGALKRMLADREAGLQELARTRALRDYLREQQAQREAAASTPDAQVQVASGAADDARATLESFIRTNPTYFAALTFVGADKQANIRVEPLITDGVVVFKPSEGLAQNVPLDERVWTTNERQPLHGAITHAPFGAALNYTVPVFADESATDKPAGAIVAELKLDALLDRIEAEQTDANNAQADVQRFVVVLDRSGQIVYHTNRALKYNPAASAMPGFASVAQAMQTGARGTAAFTTPNGARWLAAYQPIDNLDLSVAVAADVDEAGAGLQLLGPIGIGLTLLLALAAAAILTVVIQRTSSRINRVAAAAAEIAAGNLEQRIQVKSTDETRLLAESFNLMSDRLREHIAHEAESKQFQSFLRLSAMLTHDLKNSITGLSILVNNMERQFHRAEFREDAISSLRAATDKLRAIVARLNEPARTLSGEYRHALRATDLVPIIRHVLATTAEPASAMHQIESTLPDRLVAHVDSERIERVLDNLIINALEAMSTKSGRLTITAGPEDAGHVFISICDTGVGISAEFIRTRLFRPFATTKEKGIGLGLYTCREIVAAHGGRLDVQSDLGSGTCFRVVLPSTPVTRLSAPAAARAQQPTDAQTASAIDQVPQ
jgi:signal transduction histidine kinase